MLKETDYYEQRLKNKELIMYDIIIFIDYI